MKRLFKLLASAVVAAAASVASAVTYNPSDLLLVFHQSGYNDVILNIGPAANYTGLPANVPVTVSYNTNTVFSNFGSYSGLNFAVVGANDSNPHVWLSSATTNAVPADLTVNTYATLLGKIDNVGNSAKLATGGNGSPFVVDPTDFQSYSYIVSPGDAGSISSMGGDAPVTVSAGTPGAVALIQFIPTTTSPTPSAVKLGTFALDANGVLTFTPGAVTPVITASSGLNSTAVTSRGGSVTLSVSAEGATGYQWYRNGVAIAGATNSTLNLSNVQPGDLGGYTVVVSNSTYSTSTTSTSRNLRVTPAYLASDALLVFHDGSNPDVVFNLGPVSTFTGQTLGTTQPLNYNRAAVLANFGSLAGVSVSVVAAQDAANTVWMSDANLFSIPTDLTLNTYATLSSKIDGAGNVAGGLASPLDYNNPAIVSPSDPNSYSAIVSPGDISSVDSFGGDAPFTVGATVSAGSPVLVPFYALHPTNTTPAAGSFIGYFTLATGGTNVSFTAATTLTPVITATSVTNQTIPVGGNASTFTVSAVGASSYQWKLNGGNIPGATSASYTLTGAQLSNGGTYTVAALNSAYGTAATSGSSAEITVVGAPVVTVDPTSQSVWQGTNVTLSVSASNGIVGAGSNPAYSYQWKHAGTNLPGATSSSYAILSAQAADAGDYTVTVSNIAGSATSAIATITLVPDSTLPTVAIVAPKANSKIAGTNLVNTVVITGNAKDNVQLASVKYSLNGSGFANANLVGTNWSVTGLSFNPGTNTIVVKSVDLAGNESATASRDFIYTAYSTLTIATTGSGSVTPALSGANLIVGKSYKFTAVPGAGFIISNWVVAVNGTTNVVGTSSKYPFAPTVYPATLTANFVTNQFLNLVGTYNGLFSETNGVTVESAGFASINISSKEGKPATFSAKLLVAGEKVAAAGTLYVDGNGSNSKPVVFKASTNTLTVNLHVPFDGSETITGTISNNVTGWVAELNADRVLVNAGFAGTHTLVVPGTLSGPAGDGFGSVIVDATGVVSLVGNLGDGSKLAQKVAVSKNGEWPFFATANKTTVGGIPVTAGVILGWLNVSNTSPVGTVAWVKNAVAGDTYHAAGFSTTTAVESSAYTNLSPAITLVNGSAELAGGNLTSVLSNSIALSLANVFTASTNYGLKLKIVPATGLLMGTFKNPENGNAVTKIGGVVLQNANTGRGNFPGVNQYGSFELHSN